MGAINDIVENSGAFIGTLRENVIRVIENYGINDIETEHDKKIEKLLGELLRFVENNAKKRIVGEEKTYIRANKQA